MLTSKCGRTLETESKRGQQTIEKQKQRKSEETVVGVGVFQLPGVEANKRGGGGVRERSGSKENVGKVTQIKFYSIPTQRRPRE